MVVVVVEVVMVVVVVSDHADFENIVLTLISYLQVVAVE